MNAAAAPNPDRLDPMDRAEALARLALAAREMSDMVHLLIRDQGSVDGAGVAAEPPVPAASAAKAPPPAADESMAPSFSAVPRPCPRHPACTSSGRVARGIRRFFAADCIVAPDVQCTFAALYDAYRVRCHANHEPAATDKRFAMALADRGCLATFGHNHVRVYRGIRLLACGDVGDAGDLDGDAVNLDEDLRGLGLGQDPDETTGPASAPRPAATRSREEFPRPAVPPQPTLLDAFVTTWKAVSGAWGRNPYTTPSTTKGRN